jgi:hypothetical protein
MRPRTKTIKPASNNDLAHDWPSPGDPVGISRQVNLTVLYRSVFIPIYHLAFLPAKELVLPEHD